VAAFTTLTAAFTLYWGTNCCCPWGAGVAAYTRETFLLQRC